MEMFCCQNVFNTFNNVGVIACYRSLGRNGHNVNTVTLMVTLLPNLAYIRWERKEGVIGESGDGKKRNERGETEF